MKIKVGVVEDEVIIADRLCEILEDLGYDVASPAASYDEAISMIKNESPDLLLLDIQLKGKKDGIDLATDIRSKFQIPYIFLTANADTATVQRAKLTGPAAYLVKPFHKNDLYTAIEVCIQNNSDNSVSKDNTDSVLIKDAVFIRENSSFHKVKFKDILYLESEHVYLQVHTASKKYLVRSPMQQFMEYFEPGKMLRIHRSYAVNIENVQTLHADYVIINGAQLPISKSYRDALFSRVKLG